jgi:hypothetical protein
MTIPESILKPLLNCPNYLDVATAEAIQGEPLQHQPTCNCEKPNAQFLCDCGAVDREWKRLKRELRKVKE